MIKTLPRNKLTSHPAFPKIIAAYNEQLKARGRVSGLKFFKEVILAEIPDYDISAWYYFLKKAKTEAGIVQVAAGEGRNGRTPATSAGAEGLQDLTAVLLSNTEATQKAIASALNISVRALQSIQEDPESVPVEKRAELFLKVMKAQDSRVKAIGGMRADNREQERFERAQSSAAYG